MKKILMIIGRLLDLATIALLAFFQVKYLIDWNEPMFLLATCAHGIWVISVQLAAKKAK